MTRSGIGAVSNLRDFACGRVRRYLDSYLAGELTVESNHEILDHMERCEECRGEAEARESLRRVIRRVAGAAEPVPADIETRLRARLTQLPPPGPGVQIPLLALAATLLLAVGLTFVVRPVAGPGRSLTAVTDVTDVKKAVTAFAAPVDVHTSCTLAYESKWGTEAVPPERVAVNAGPGYAAALPGIESALPGYVPVAAHRCRHSGPEVVHVILRSRTQTGPHSLVSVVIVDHTVSDPALSGLKVGDATVGPRGQQHHLALVGGAYAGYEVAGLETYAKRLFVVAHGSGDGPGEAVRIGKEILPALVTAAGTVA